MFIPPKIENHAAIWQLPRWPRDASPVVLIDAGRCSRKSAIAVVAVWALTSAAVFLLRPAIDDVLHAHVANLLALGTVLLVPKTLPRLTVAAVPS